MRRFTGTAIILSLVLLFNCATVQNFGEPEEDPVYVLAGTRANLLDLGNTRSPEYCFAKLDFPFSFVLDLILLPVAIPLALTSQPKPISDPDSPEPPPEKVDG